MMRSGLDADQILTQAILKVRFLDGRRGPGDTVQHGTGRQSTAQQGRAEREKRERESYPFF